MPENDQSVAQLLLLAEGSSDNIIEQLVTNDYSHARIRAFIPDIGAVAMMELKDKFNRHSEALFNGTGIKKSYYHMQLSELQKSPKYYRRVKRINSLCKKKNCTTY